MMQFFEISLILFSGGWSFAAISCEHYSRVVNASFLNKNRESKNTALPEIKFKF
jgi:hypothetical protein